MLSTELFGMKTRVLVERKNCDVNVCVIRECEVVPERAQQT